MSQDAAMTLPRYDVSRHAREGGYASIAHHGGAVVAARARQGQRDKWAREIDPLGLLDALELARRLDARLRQQMAKLTAARMAKAAARRAEKQQGGNRAA